MTDVNGFGLEHAFGRVEGKLDSIDSKLDRHGEKLAEHGARLDRVEEDVKEIKATGVQAQRHGMTGRQLMTVAVGGAVTSGLVALLVQLFTTHR